MSKKNKKKPQQNLSLKDRLGKHWNNRNWGSFISLYTRDKAASTRSPWAAHWQEALFNCLTEALFVEKNFQLAKTTLDLIREEGKEISSGLRDCASVAADFLRARQNGFPAAPCPLENKENLPPLYASLRGKFASLVSAAAKGKKSRKNDAAVLVKKLAAQYGKLKGAKSASPWSTWRKIAEQLETAAEGIDSAGTFCAVHAIIRLICELVRPGRNVNLRVVESLPCHPLFRAIPANQSHPAIGMLWDFFCRLGERQYGEEWGMAARVLQLAFMAKTDRLEPLKKQYDRLTETDTDKYIDGKNLARSLFSDTSLGWTEQEHYILRTLFVLSCDLELDENSDIPIFMEDFKIFLESFEVLGRLGRRWRPRAPWFELIRVCFEEFVLNLPHEMLFILAERDLPWEIVSTPAVLYTVLYDQSGVQRLKNVLSYRLPLSLSPEEIRKILRVLNPYFLKVAGIRVLRIFLDDAGFKELLESWVRRIIWFSGKDAVDGKPPSQQLWHSLKKDLLKELIAALPSDSPEGCLCELFCEGEKLCSNSSEANAFFNAFSSRIARSGHDSEDFPWAFRLLMFLLTRPEAASDFLLRLIGVTLPLYRKVTEEEREECLDCWEKIADIVGRMTDRNKQKTVALGICAQMKRIEKTYRDGGFTAALRYLKKFEGTTRKPK